MNQHSHTNGALCVCARVCVCVHFQHEVRLLLVVIIPTGTDDKHMRNASHIQSETKESVAHTPHTRQSVFEYM